MASKPDAYRSSRTVQVIQQLTRAIVLEREEMKILSRYSWLLVSPLVVVASCAIAWIWQHPATAGDIHLYLTTVGVLAALLSAIMLGMRLRGNPSSLGPMGWPLLGTFLFGVMLVLLQPRL